MIGDRLAEQLGLLPGYLANHVLLVLTALGAGILISLPLGIAATRRRSLEGPLLALTGVLQTVPSLALLALMVPLLGRIGFLPALLALILYSMLPVVRNTVVGIRSVEPSLIEAGRGLGMTDRQLLTEVELPLATPIVMAGIRTASVWVVGAATLSTPVGASSLGNYIFSGLQTQNYTAVLVGVFGAALLALGIDGLLHLVERPVSRRPVGLLIVALAALVPAGVLTAATLLDPGSAQPLRIGTKTFTEQYIVADVIEQRLRNAGFEAEQVRSLGSTVAFDALAAGRIDCYVDYSGTIWANQMGRSDNPGRQAVFEQMREWLAAGRAIVAIDPLGFENAYAIAVRRDRAEQLGLRSVGDLAEVAGSWTLGGDYEFFSRPEWRSLQSAYRLSFRETRSFDSSLMYSAVQTGTVEAIAAFSTDGRIAAFDLVVLTDDLQALPPYDAVLLVSGRAAGRPGVLAALGPLAGTISDRKMREANRQVDVDGATVSSAASWLLAAGEKARP